MRIVQAPMAALLVAAASLGTLAAAAPALAGEAPASAAYGFSADIASQGSAMTIPAIARVVGSGSKPYSRSTSAPLFSESFGLVSAGNLAGAVAIVSSGIASHVSGTGTAGATVQAEADSSMASLQIDMTLLPPPGSTQAPGAPLLSLTATGIASQVTDTRTLPSVGQQAGQASFGALSITGSLIGTQTLSFQGAAPPNTVLYSDSNMAVTLNGQTVSGVIACTPTCQFVPKSIAGNAVSVAIFQKPLIGKAKMTGEMLVGHNLASVP